MSLPFPEQEVGKRLETLGLPQTCKLRPGGVGVAHAGSRTVSPYPHEEGSTETTNEMREHKPRGSRQDPRCGWVLTGPPPPATLIALCPGPTGTDLASPHARGVARA